MGENDNWILTIDMTLDFPVYFGDFNSDSFYGSDFQTAYLDTTGNDISDIREAQKRFLVF